MYNLFLYNVAEKQKKIHRGEVLRQVAAESDLSITQITRRAGYKTRGSYYDHIEDADLSFEILERYGKALHHNFREDFPSMPEYSFEEAPSPSYKSRPATLEEAFEIIEYWRSRFYEELEKTNSLLEQLNRVSKATEL
ncbi:hypothetical protein [Parafilimonas sp.]|uniref:hypothetical protein n=1 Tax=Parafilimonas sp. TaxID=1969739 RepID=UPI0039E6729C